MEKSLSINKFIVDSSWTLLHLMHTHNWNTTAYRRGDFYQEAIYSLLLSTSISSLQTLSFQYPWEKKISRPNGTAGFLWEYKFLFLSVKLWTWVLKNTLEESTLEQGPLFFAQYFSRLSLSQVSWKQGWINGAWSCLPFLLKIYSRSLQRWGGKSELAHLPPSRTTLQNCSMFIWG